MLAGSSFSDLDLGASIYGVFDERTNLLKDFESSAGLPSLARFQTSKDNLQHEVLNGSQIDVSFDNFPYYLRWNLNSQTTFREWITFSVIAQSSGILWLFWLLASLYLFFMISQFLNFCLLFYYQGFHHLIMMCCDSRNMVAINIFHDQVWTSLIFPKSKCGFMFYQFQAVALLMYVHACACVWCWTKVQAIKNISIVYW